MTSVSRLVKLLLKFSGDSFDADYECSDDKREKALNNATQDIKSLFMEIISETDFAYKDASAYVEVLRKKVGKL